MSALQFHPAFVSSKLFRGLPFAELLPALTLEIDSIAEGVDTVGVEWHVDCGESAFPLGRGLSQAQVCRRTGKIKRVVDIAEAPWRVIGLVAQPFIAIVQVVWNALVPGKARPSEVQTAEQAAWEAELRDAISSTQPSEAEAPTDFAVAAANMVEDLPDVEREYLILLTAVLADGLVHPNERAVLAAYELEHGVSEKLRGELLTTLGWSEADFAAGRLTRDA